MKQLATILNIGLATLASLLGGYWVPVLVVGAIIATILIFVFVRNSKNKTEEALERSQKREKERLEQKAKEVEKEKQKHMEEAKEEFQEDIENPPDDMGSALDSQINELKERYQ